MRWENLMDFKERKENSMIDLVLRTMSLHK